MHVSYLGREVGLEILNRRTVNCNIGHYLLMRERKMTKGRREKKRRKNGEKQAREEERKEGKNNNYGVCGKVGKFLVHRL